MVASASTGFAAEGHVIVVSVEGSFTVSGVRLTGPVDTVDKLAKLIEWAYGRGALQPIPGVGAPPRIWLIGAAGGVLVGRPGDSGVAVDQIGRELVVLIGQGWELKRSVSGFSLARGAGQQAISAELVVESRPWLGQTAVAPTDDPVELGRRINKWCVAVGSLPGSSAETSGAVLVDEIMRARTARKTGAVVSQPGILPRSVAAATRIQPVWTPKQSEVETAIEHADTLVLLQQLCPQLASAGMLSFGYGPSSTLAGAAAAAAAESSKRAFGLWHATLPACDSLQLPADLAAPHPWMRADEPTRVWLTGEDLDGLARDPRDGGAGIPVGALSIDEAIVWPHQGRLLEAWAMRLREARDVFADDTPMRSLVDSAAENYLSALAEAPTWVAEGWRHHYQPVWAATIASHVRFRGRRVATRISREYRVWPIYVEDTSTVYALDGSGDETPIDLSDSHTRLGRLVEQRRTELLDETVLAIVLAEDTADLASEIAGAVGMAAMNVVVEDRAGDAGAVDEDGCASAEDAQPATAAAGETKTLADSGVDTQKEVQPVIASAPRRAAPAKVAVAHAGSPAAVLHTDGLWLADGTQVSLPEPLLHVGHVAELAYQHNLGYQLSSKYAERGQIWMTADACAAFGIDIESINRRDRAKSLRELTKGIEFVDLAVAEGWSLGGAGDEPDVHRLGSWTRVYRDDKRGVMVALIPGMGDADEMPILADDPTPAQLAARLQLLADALRFPWKINAGVTAVDLMLQTRPKTWAPAEWRDVVHAPSTTDVPFGITDVESDFNWSRRPTDDERGQRFVHAYDRGGSYIAGIAGLELPIGAAVHHPDGVPFNAKTPGYWLINVPDAGDWRIPYLLNPRGLKFSGPKWVCTPRLERAIALGYQFDILEAWVWPQHGRVLLGWYERFRDASTQLDIDDPDAQAVRNQTKIVRTHGVGILGSAEYLKGKTGYSPERRLHVMAKANSNIVYRMAQIGERSGRWPLAASTDTVLYASDEPDPVRAWPGDPATLGRGFGQYKPEASGMLAEHDEYLNGREWMGKHALIPASEWMVGDMQSGAKR